jgi:hypothetical protein
MIMLILKNYHLWIKELQKLIEQYRVWEYVDSKETKSKLIIEDYSNFFDIVMTLNVTVITRSNVLANQSIRSARSINELIDEQQRNLQQRQFIWSMREKLMRRAKRGIQIVHQAVKTSTRQYISSSEMRSSIREIIQTLADRYKQSNVKIVELLHEQYHSLKSVSLVKTKIVQWISEWKNLRIEMINQELRDTFDNDVIFVHEFLRADKRWAFVFCETWIIQHQAIEKDLNFFKIIYAYKDAYENFLRNEKSIKDMIEAITLQKVDQNQVDSHICTKKNDEKHKNKICICDQVHLFSQCSYIVSVNKTSRWRKTSKFETRRDRKFSKRFTCFIRSNE